MAGRNPKRTATPESRDDGPQGSPDAAAVAGPFSVPGAPLAGVGFTAVVTRVATGPGEPGLDAEIYLDIDADAPVEVLAPAALVAVPGLLIMLAVVAQVVGGALWIPLAGRLLGDRAGRSRPSTARVPADRPIGG